MARMLTFKIAITTTYLWFFHYSMWFVILCVANIIQTEHMVD